MRISDWSSDVCSSDLSHNDRSENHAGCEPARPCHEAHVIFPVVLQKAGEWRKPDGLSIPFPAAAGEVGRALCYSFRNSHASGRRGNGRSVTAAAVVEAWSFRPDRKSVVSGNSVSVRVALGGGRILKKKKNL